MRQTAFGATHGYFRSSNKDDVSSKNRKEIRIGELRGRAAALQIRASPTSMRGLTGRPASPRGRGPPSPSVQTHLCLPAFVQSFSPPENQAIRGHAQSKGELSAVDGTSHPTSSGSSTVESIVTAVARRLELRSVSAHSPTCLSIVTIRSFPHPNLGRLRDDQLVLAG